LKPALLFDQPGSSLPGAPFEALPVVLRKTARPLCEIWLYWKRFQCRYTYAQSRAASQRNLLARI